MTANHQAVFENLEDSGSKVKYILKETVPDGYASSIMPGGIEVTIGGGGGGIAALGACCPPGGNTVVDVVNWPTRGRLEVNKFFEDGTATPAGFMATFELKQGDTLIDTQTTDGSAPAVFDNLPEGDYTLYEVSMPAGWTCSIEGGATVHIAGGCKTTLDVTNYKDGGIEVDKLLFNLEFPDGTPHAGIEFYLDKECPRSNAGGLTAHFMTATTDADGKAYFNGLAPGCYWLTEQELPAGMVSSLGDGRCVCVKAGEMKVVSVRNTEIPDGSIVIIKQYNDSNENEVDLELWGDYLTDGPSMLVRSGTTTGLIWIVSDIQPGMYTLVENPVPDGYECPDNNQLVEAPEVGFNVYYIHNNFIPGRIIVNKTFSDGANLDVSFELRQGDSLLASGVTSAGQLIFSDLHAGTYNLTELVPGGYTSNLAAGTEVEVVAGEDTIVNVNNTRTPPGDNPGGDEPGEPGEPGEPSEPDEPEQPEVTVVETTPTAIIPAVTELIPETTALGPPAVEVVVPEEPAALPKTGAENGAGIALLAMMFASSGMILRRFGH